MLLVLVIMMLVALVVAAAVASKGGGRFGVRGFQEKLTEVFPPEFFSGVG